MSFMGTSTSKPRTFVRLCAIIVTCAFLESSAAWGQVVPPIGMLPLNQIAVPQPPNLSQFVKNVPAAITLGKAFFWDMQAGSDGIQACATCHFKAGADPRLKNQLSPGINAGDSLFGNISTILAGTPGITGFPQFAPNYTLNTTLGTGDFPFHQRQAPADSQSSPVIRDTNDVVSSQGVRLSQFVSVTPGSAVDVTTPLADPVFNIGGVNTRRVEPRNTPTVINAVFNFSNFWDGRAHFIFNGVNPFGPLDQTAQIWVAPAAGAAPVQQQVAIQFASLASQAVGPPLSAFEMSAQGRTFPDVGRKLLSLIPLGRQIVHPGDSVLGVNSNAVVLPNGSIGGAPGLKISYQQMIQNAFANNLWNGAAVPGVGTQMEANFSLFWGLAIQLYEATLIADQTPFDSFLAGTPNALTPLEQQGFGVFNDFAGCAGCHIGTELTSASVSNIRFVSNVDNGVLDLMFAADGTQNIYDEGFNNTGVTPTSDDLGRGGTTPATILNLTIDQPFPLSFSRLAIMQAGGVGGPLPFGTPQLPANVPNTMRASADGSFKMPGLRNVELTAPYFHNGSVFTLEDVVDFYARGGNFPATNIADLDPRIAQGAPLLKGNQARKDALVAFLKALTDQRVVRESAPFDHPEIFVPEGEPEVLTRIPAKDALGNPASTPLTINTVSSPTNRAAQTISGTVQAGLTTPNVTLNAAAPLTATVAGTSWSASITGLTEGPNTIKVTTLDVGGVAMTVTANITLDTVPPALTLDSVGAPVKTSALSVTGTVEAGLTPSVSVSTGAAAGPVKVSLNGTWSTKISGLVSGINTVTATATDAAGNITTASTAINALLPDGSLFGGAVTVLDALKALQFAVGLISPTPDDLFHGDIAPLGAPDGRIDVSDCLLILKKAVGLINF